MDDFSGGLFYFGIISVMEAVTGVSLLNLREAIEASWASDTAYKAVHETANPALGNCYPTARIVQYFFPDTEIVEGTVWTGASLEKHFWNLLIKDGTEYHIDLSWRQFPAGSTVKAYEVRDRKTLGDSKDTIRRVELLLRRVRKHLKV